MSYDYHRAHGLESRRDLRRSSVRASSTRQEMNNITSNRRAIVNQAVRGSIPTDIHFVFGDSKLNVCQF